MIRESKGPPGRRLARSKQPASLHCCHALPTALLLNTHTPLKRKMPELFPLQFSNLS